MGCEVAAIQDIPLPTQMMKGWSRIQHLWILNSPN
jgi:hypothetical protein